LRSIEVWKGLENKDTVSDLCNKPKLGGGDKLGYTSNWPKKPNVNMVAATVHTRQQLKRVEKASLLPLFKNNLRNPFKLWD
jgi:hypothetical protein